jgi:hypothetical protein
MAVLYTIVEGWTAELGPFTLKVNGQPKELTGFEVKLKLRPVASNAYVDTIGDVNIDPAQEGAGKGMVTFKPDADDFKASKSPYSLRWEVTDSDGNTVYFPNSKNPDTIEVVKP